MPSNIIPWQSSLIPSEITSEMDRRKTNRSFNYINNITANWDSTNGDWKTYKGPMLSWIRFCSNGRGAPDLSKDKDDKGNYKSYSKSRFVFYSGKGFYQSYGFQPTSAGGLNQVIGYMPNGETHTIDNSLTLGNEPKGYPIHVAPPEISRIEVTVQQELFRRAQIEWVCFSWKQLVYLTPYFLVPGISCMLEWGWNHFNTDSLVDLTNVDGKEPNMKSLWDNSYPLYTNNIIKSNGNYDVIYGIISNFNWSMEGNKILCTTEITSKDRLYAGIAKDYGLSVNTNNSDDPRDGIFRSIKDFINNKDTILNLKSIVTSEPILDENGLMKIMTKNKVPAKLDGVKRPSEPSIKIVTWYDILNPLISKSKGETSEQVGMRIPYLFGYFDGRPTDHLKGKIEFGDALSGDFDKNNTNNNVNRIWINMGLVVRMLNYFSATDSGANKGKNMFEVDIQNTVINGHPNLVSCDSKVLIPNSSAPKFMYGNVGINENIGAVSKSVKNNTVDNDLYLNQKLYPTKLTDKSSLLYNQNQTLRSVLYQLDGNIYRDDLDTIINYNRYRFSQIVKSYGKNLPTSYCFPANFDSSVPLPDSPRGLSGNKLEKYYSGLLSNIYISYGCLQDIINDDNNHTYTDIYNKILEKLNNASDRLWDLSLIEVDNVITIADRNYIGRYALNTSFDKSKSVDKIYSFDYYDVDSIIKSLKFKPILADAQATRAIYGSINNPDSKYTYVDKNDLLDYQFKDAVITPENTTGNSFDSSAELEKRQSESKYEELRELLRTVQYINTSSDDESLQMSLADADSGATVDKRRIIKLVLPTPQLLKLLLHDEDFDNNPRYCAVQPGITLEMTIQGIGGLRTFMYFLVRNLPEPYSERNIIFRITDVVQTLETGNWETVIRAQPTPLRKYLWSRMIGPLGPNGKNNGWGDLVNSNQD